MAKIVKIQDGIVFIGKDNGEIKEVHRTSLNFQPNIGDNVDIFGIDDNPIIVLSNQLANQNITNHIITYANNHTKKTLNKVSYCLLALFLGGLGVHKFYEGKTGMGILYLLFCWTFIPTIVATIEFFIALFKTADEQGNIYL